MMKLKTKTKISTMTLVLIFAISTIAVVVPTATAQNTQATYPFLGAVPNPVGKGQTVLFHVGIFQQLSAAQEGWTNMSITIERPDGVIDTISDIKTDSTGGTGKTYTPNLVGDYYCQAHFPEQVLEEGKTAPGLELGTVMLASDSAVLKLVVQEDAIEYYPGHNLPTEYWDRPIDAQLREWSVVTGSWLEPTLVSPQVVDGNEDAPETAHILWRQALTMGGIADEAYYGWGFSHGDAYEGKWTNRIIIDGILIYLHRTNDSPLLYHAVDVHTGEELWSKTILDGRTISFAQNLKWEGYNHHAVYPYFYVSTGGDWIAFDPYTGNQEFTVENVPSGTRVSDENGWLYIVNVDYNSGEGYVWSMVDLIEPFGSNSPAPGSWLPAGSFYGSRRGVWDAAEMENGTLTEEAQRAYIAEFTVDVEQCPGGSGAVRATAFGDRIFGLQYGLEAINTWAISLEEGNEGDILFSETWEAPAWWAEGQVQIEFNTVSLADGAAAFWVKDTLQYYCFSTDNGEFMWGPSEPEYYMNYYGWTELGERPPLMWEGKLYSTGAGGIIYCYDLTDGHVLWDYASEDPYQEYLFANNWWQFFLWIVDGKLYTGHMEHSAIEPIPRGAPFMCLDATSGDLIWQADGLFRSTRWGGRGIIGDSIMVTMDTYDNNIYAVGKGQSVLTVDKALAATEKGSAVTVQGTIMDVSPGTQETLMQIRFPNGVPAVSDADMSEWMLYVYKNFERPAATGVNIKLEAVDPDGEYTDLGTTNSDAYGNWAFAFCPDKAGTYMIVATFAGSGAYYGSTQTSYLTVVDPVTVEPQEVDLSSLENGQSTLTTYLLVVLVLVIIAIILALYSVIAKRK